uniref:Suppressor of forked domain-containing protein n=1 Tax=Meloidogyne enterolobii TaxID=390850 RepID=A0A6V7UA00_MELEN|nr:unnamed protein product [Meloidogyne enterolobii]
MVLSPERRIELNPFDVDAWNLLLRESQARPIDQVRGFYERLVSQFNNAGRYWKAYIEHELRAKNFENVEKIFERCLVRVLNVDLWKCYVFYVRETKGHLASFREQMAKTYDFAIDKVGMDFQREVKGQYAENQKITAIRKIFKKGLVTPMANIEQLWNDYCSFEKSVNPALAEKMISDIKKDYLNACKVTKQYEQIVRGINRQAISIPPRGTTTEIKQAELWRKYIQWEKSNPLNTEEYGQYARRVIYSYEQALLCLGYMPDIWYEAAFFQQQAAQRLAEKGDVKLSTAMYNDIIHLYEKAVSGLMKSNQMLHFAYADFEEERRKYDNAKKIYDRLLSQQSVDPSLTNRRLKQARLVFKRAREDKRNNFHVYVAAAYMEYYCSKEPEIAKRIFDLGLRKFSKDPEYALAYVDFLSNLNEETNTRVVFERLLNSENALAPENSGEIWDKYLDFESQVGDLTSILNVDQRRRATNPHSEEHNSLWLIDRYKFLNLTPCTLDELKLMGYSLKCSKHISLSGHSHNIPSSATQNGHLKPTQIQNISSSTNIGTNLLELGAAYARPDTSQMLPFKPKLPQQHIIQCLEVFFKLFVCSVKINFLGVFPPPLIISQLLQLLPPPRSFTGPYVDIEELVKSLGSFNREPPRVNLKEGPSLDPNATFDDYRAADVKKELYQLLNTTTDPIVLMASSEYQQQQQSIIGSRKRTFNNTGDSDSEDESQRQALGGDLYKSRMQIKTVK